MTAQGAQNAITKHRVQPPSVNTENYHIFYKFQYLSHLALIGSQTLSDCVVCGMMSRSQPQNKFSSDVIPVSSIAPIPCHSIPFHSGAIFLFIVLFGPFACVSQEAALCLQVFFSSHFRQRRRRTLPVKPCPLLWQICAYFSWFCASSLVKQI